MDLQLRYVRNTTVNIRCAVDADHANDREDRKSISGHAIFLNSQQAGGAISWSSRKQSVVALSSTEAEYVASSEALSEIIFVRQLLSDMGNPVLKSIPTIVEEDNQSCIAIAENPVNHSRTKHIDVKHHRIRDEVQKGTIQFVYVPTSEQTADILTKNLPKATFNKFRDRLLGYTNR